MYGRTAKLGEVQFWTRLGECLGRWDRRLGAAYAGLANRRLSRDLVVAATALLLTALMLGKGQVVLTLLAANRSPHELTTWMSIFNQFAQVPLIVLELLLVIARGPARTGVARFSSIPAALAGTVAPLFLVLESRGGSHTALTILGSVLLVVGMGWLIWSLMKLGRCFSIMPEVRGLVTNGPYRWVRHPVYLGEITATLGLMLPVLSPSNIVIFALFCGLQLWRTCHEEANLGAAFPEYDDYRLRTARLLPGLW